MKERTRRILIMAVMAALIVSLMAASLSCIFTYGRYAGGRRDENSPYEDYIDFVGATAFTVQTPEELTNAIENGYSYIEIDDNAEEPFVVNDDIANVTTNLVLDVNGTTVIRNSRNPLLDVKRSVSVVLVYDSSTEQAGGFYNPVGSALQTSGGTLTVGAGVYESGPNEEYQTESYQTGQQVTLFTRTDRTGPYPETGASVKDLPILTGKNVGTPEDPVSVYDYYFEIAPEGNVNPLIEDDTYLIYTKESNCYEKDGQLLVNCTKTETEAGTEISGTSFSVESNVASCDFYYYYPVNGTAGTADAFQEYAVVYGYHDVKALARDEKKTDENGTEYGMASALTGSGLVWPYAAIRSVEDPETQEGGVTHARGGAFTTNFGTDNTYGILSVGGEMTVGTESATAPPTFTAVGEGTCIGMSAQTGDTLTIASGTFTSEVGDTILMRGGEMTVTGGTFTKSGNKARPSGGLEAIEASRTALIHMLGGELTIDGTVGTDTSGNPTYSVNMTAERPNNTPLTNVFGIYSEQSSSGDSGTVTVSGCDISVNGTYSAGVLSSAGTVNVGGAENGKAQTKITVAESIEDDQLTSSAVSSEGGTINLNSDVNITSDSLGITARGTINVKSGETTVNTPNATGVYVNNGTLNVDEEATLDVESTVNANLEWVTPPGTGPINAPNIYNGVYVQGGSLVSNGTLNVTFTGVENDAYGSGANSNLNANTAYRDFQIKSYAVRVEGGTNTEGTNTNTTVKIVSGTILNGAQSDLTRDEEGNITGISGHSGVGGGILVNGGTVTLGVENGKGPTVQTTGTSVETTDRNPFGYGGNWQYRLPVTGGPAVKVAGGESTTIYGGSYNSQQGDGIVTTGGNCTIYNGTFYGNDSYGMQAGPGASYSFKVYGGTVTVKDGTFGSDDPNAYGGGAFVAGTAQEMATAQINGGSFLSGGQAAFSILDNATVIFGENNAANITVQGGKAGLVLEGYSGIGSAEITINGGKFSSTSTDESESSAIWSGNPNFKLTINGGELTGGAKDGIFIARRTWNNENDPFIGTLKITGGKITGNTHGLNLDRDIKSKNAVEISGNAVLKGTNGSGINFGKTIEEDNVHITGGQYIGAQRAFGGQGTCQIFKGADGTVAYLYNGNNNTSIGYNGNMTNNIADIPYSNITVRTQ